MACESKAKRGLNVDTISLLLGPGGVGLSLQSAHLDARYGKLHAFFDPAIFHEEGELRKFVETLHGSMIQTGQDNLERSTRETFKKSPLPRNSAVVSRMPP